MMRDYIVRDSSIWRDMESFEAADRQNNAVMLGLVRSGNFNEETQEIFYVVEVQSEGDKMLVPCRPMVNIGGIFNYEEYTLQTYEYTSQRGGASAFETKAGDTVLVTFLNGDPREGVILGGLHHPGRPRQLQLEDGSQYKRVINGVEHSINDSGEYTVTFRGVPTNIDILSEKPTNETIPEPEYDEEVGSTFFKFDAEGGFTLSDNATEDSQSLHINKAEGVTTLTSGSIVLTMSKQDESTSLVTSTLNINAEDSVTINTSDIEIEASSTAKLKSPKIAIGSDGTELLNELVELINALGQQTIITPTGPASPISASPQWSQVASISQKINGIKGSL
jgi:phage gp45-like